MSEIVRFSVSLEDDLLEQFDRFCTEQHFATRSEAVRQLIRDKLTAHAWASDAQDVAGTLTLVYDHHRQQLRDQLTALQHDHMEMVVSTLHAHLTHDLCLEVIVLRRPRRQAAADRLEAPGAEGDFEGRIGDGGREIREVGQLDALSQGLYNQLLFSPLDILAASVTITAGVLLAEYPAMSARLAVIVAARWRSACFRLPIGPRPISRSSCLRPISSKTRTPARSISICVSPIPWSRARR